MNARIFTTIALTVLLVACTALMVAAQDDEMILDRSIYNKLTWPPVNFNHLEHADDLGLECAECHHLFKGGKNIWEEDDAQACEECHNDPTVKNERRLPMPKQKLNLKIAFHDNCKGRHRTYDHENDTDAAPIRCQGCHTGE